MMFTTVEGRVCILILTIPREMQYVGLLFCCTIVFIFTKTTIHIFTSCIPNTLCESYKVRAQTSRFQIPVLRHVCIINNNFNCAQIFSPVFQLPCSRSKHKEKLSSLHELLRTGENLGI